MYKKICAICKKSFETKYRSKSVCSYECKQEKARRVSRYFMRTNRHPKTKKPQKINGKFRKNQNKPCVICGYKETIDLHHEGKDRTYFLCPNHHALITRNVKTIEELLATT